MNVTTYTTCELSERVLVNPFNLELYWYLREQDWSTHRGKHVQVQKDTVSIALRGASKFLVRPGDNYSFHTQIITNTHEARHFPMVMTFLRQFAKRKHGLLSRVMIVKLLPKKQVYGHSDYGEYYDIRDRYHLVLSSQGSEMLVGGITSTFVTGDLFYFNNHIMHEAFNNSDEDRIHVIFDILPLTASGMWRYVWSILKTGMINIWYFPVEKARSLGERRNRIFL